MLQKRTKAAICFFTLLSVFAEAELFNDDARASELASPWLFYYLKYILFGSKQKSMPSAAFTTLEHPARAVKKKWDATQRTCSSCLSASIERRAAACPSLPG